MIPLLPLAASVAIWILLKATLLVGLAYGVTRCLDRAPASVRHLIWGMALLGVVVTPLLGPVVPGWGMEAVSGWMPAWTVESTSATAVVSAEGAAGANGALRAPGSDVTEAAAEEASGARAASAGEASAVDWASLGRIVAGFALFIWAAGTLLLLARFLVGVLRIARISGRADPAGKKLSAWMDRIADDGLRSVEVRFTSEVNVPVNWGLLEPIILLPAEAREWPQSRIRVVCRHEWAHVRRWDYATHVIGQIARALAWPNPGVWWGVRSLYREQEEACDDEVVRSGIPAADYADHLLALLRSWHRDPAVLRGALTLAPSGGVKDRIRRMLDENRDRRPLGMVGAATILLLGGCVALPVIGFQGGPAGHGERSERAIWIEAEDGWLQRPMHVENGIEASGWSYLEVEDDQESRAEVPDDGRATYEFEVREPGTYRIWGRVRTDDNDEDSFWVRIDGGDWVRWNGLEKEEEWVWQTVHDADREDWPTAEFDLEAGAHTLELAFREPDARIDRFAISSDTTFAPAGRGPLPGDHRTVALEKEAEQGRITAPMQVDRTEHGVRYVQVSDGPGNDPPGGGPGMTEIRFEVPRSDTYVVWGRIRAPNTNDNSFFVSIDGGEELIWDTPGLEETSDGWTWDPVSSRESERIVDPVRFELSAGVHRLRIRNREDGTRLDRILISNAPIDPDGSPSPSSGSSGAPALSSR